MEDGEKEDTAREGEQTKAPWAEVTKKKKRRRGQKVEKPEAFMANFFKGLEIYQTKLLVSAPALAPLGAGVGQGRPQQSGHQFCFTVWLVVLPHVLIPLLVHLPVPFVLEKRKRINEKAKHSSSSAQQW